MSDSSRSPSTPRRWHSLEDESAAVDDETNIFHWPPHFTKHQRTTVAMFAPSLLSLPNPYPYFIFIGILSIVVGVAVTWEIASNCASWASDIYTKENVVNVQKYIKLVSRSSSSHPYRPGRKIMDF